MKSAYIVGATALVLGGVGFAFRKRIKGFLSAIKTTSTNTPIQKEVQKETVNEARISPGLTKRNGIVV